MITNETELVIYPSTKSIFYIPSTSLDVALMNIQQGEFWRVFNELFKKTKYYKDDFHHALCCVERFLFEFGFHEGDLQFDSKLFRFLRNSFCTTEETTPIFAKKTTQARWIRKKLVNNFNKSTTSLTTSEIEGHIGNFITSYYERNDVRVSIEIRKIYGRKIPYISILVTDESGKHEPICITDNIDCRKVYEKVGLSWTEKPGSIKFSQLLIPSIDCSSGDVLNSPMKTLGAINYHLKEHQERIFYSPRGKYILNYICSLIYITIQQADEVTGEHLRPVFGIENDKIVLLWKK